MSDLGRALDSAIGAVEEADALDPWVERAGDVVAPLAVGAPRRVLSGAWLGHALHPMLTDLPIGLWTSAWVLDLVGGRDARPAAQRLVGAGVACAVPTAMAGWSDWGAATDDRVRRVGLVHAAANGAATVAFAGSWLARRQGRHATGVAWGMVGATLATAGGHLGGHLVLRRGAGFSERPPTPPPPDVAPS